MEAGMGEGKDVLIVGGADPEADKIARALELADQQQRIEQLEKINKDLQELVKLQQAEVKPNNYPKPGPSGNTVGLIIPKTESAPAGGDTNPPVQPETPQEKSLWGKASPWVHGTLGVASFVPGLSVVTGAIDASIYAGEGDYLQAQSYQLKPAPPRKPLSALTFPLRAGAILSVIFHQYFTI
jgi:hypothetical protein